jgi:hypothetical protein
MCCFLLAQNSHENEYKLYNKKQAQVYYIV